MVTLRRIAFAATLVLVVLLAAVFAYANPDPVPIDLGLVRLEGVSLAVAFAVAFAAGWLFGLLTAGLTLWRSAADTRRLRKDLRYAEAELKGLKTLPAPDAD